MLMVDMDAKGSRILVHLPRDFTSPSRQSGVGNSSGGVPRKPSWCLGGTMAHNHGNEYQLKIVQEDGSEELGAWMSSPEQVSQVLSAVHRQQGKTYWLR